MKKIVLVLMAVSLGAVGAFATPEGTDNAGNYGGTWTNGSNGGTAGTFNPWDLTNNGGGGFSGYFLGSSTDGSGDINTGGLSFGIFANPAGAFADALRSFGSTLSVGQTFSIDIAVNFRNGNKGFSLFDGATEIFNLNVGGDDYTINGLSIGAGYSSTAVFSLSLTQTSLTTGTYAVFYSGTSLFYNGGYTGLASGFKLYNSGTDTGDATNNLYFNNLAIVPEPSSLVLIAGPAVLGAWFFVRRRRSA